jgi:outer membrane lipoprotein SlyB
MSTRTVPPLLILLGLGVISTASLASASEPPKPVYSRSEAGTAWSVNYGAITAIESVQIEGRRSQIGRIGGGLIGYELGRSVGQNSGRAIAGAVGGVVGAVAGQATEERMTRIPALQISVALNRGEEIVVVQPADQPFRIGDKVKVLRNQHGGARVARP